MYGLPEDFDPSTFMGAEVSAVCISTNTVQIHFDLDRLITLQGSFAHSVDSSHLNDLVVPEGSTTLARLPGRVVVSASAQSGRDLRLDFDDGQVVVCVDDSTMYESYSINLGGREIIV